MTNEQDRKSTQKEARRAVSFCRARWRLAEGGKGDCTSVCLHLPAPSSCLSARLSLWLVSVPRACQGHALTMSCSNASSFLASASCPHMHACSKLCRSTSSGHVHMICHHLISSRFRPPSLLLPQPTLSYPPLLPQKEITHTRIHSFIMPASQDSSLAAEPLLQQDHQEEEHPDQEDSDAATTRSFERSSLSSTAHAHLHGISSNSNGASSTTPRILESITDIRLFDGQNSPQNIAVYGFGLGGLFGASIVLATIVKTSIPQFWLFLAALGVFHALEYIAIALFNPTKLKLDCKFLRWHI